MKITEFNKFIVLKIFLFNYMTTKIHAHNIEHQPNIGMIIWDSNKLTKCKQRQITKSNSKSIKY